MAIHFVYDGLEDFLNVLRDQKLCAEEAGFDLLVFSEVEHDFLRRHEAMIEREKLRIFKYAPDKQQLILKMPIRAVFVAQGRIFRYLTQQMTKVGMKDDDWMLLNGGDFELENGWTVEPDLALYSMANNKRTSLFPRIVFEIGISQSVEELRSRGDDYIRYSEGKINAVIYKAFRRPDQDQAFESVIWGRGLITFDKDGHSITTGPMIIPIGKVHPGTPDELELSEENLVKITEKFMLERWQE
ncbi:uncharacterized protein N7518_001770 [Penicillium psychrosexuale]|uniref:uncharacterized protein n=1 Tax=Penicillium psychrosexuale TaxID=1002107 RepID=UPI002545A5BC|nr:uncharacterized protein N7518_001770 [Penicillium psychrosexuale]KAJ5799702.1 hypothetical protein N7518_001770 [Penicillium psychrosexuale]